MIELDTLAGTLGKSALFSEYRQAFCNATGLPLSLRPVESWQLPQHGSKYENRFCSFMAQKSRSCASCLQVQQRLSQQATKGPFTTSCVAGISETAVPVRTGEVLIGFLQTGQVFRSKPTAGHFDRTAKLMAEWELDLDMRELRDAYFSTRVVGTRQYASTVELLRIFAEHLSMVSNQIVVQAQTSEPPVIRKAKQFIQDRYADDLSLEQVARSVNMSMFYFCKLFKRATGLNFTEFLSGVRIEKAKNLLLNRNLRVSEIAYEVGFQSLTHFNRVFRARVDLSPSDYRDQLPGK